MTKAILVSKTSIDENYLDQLIEENEPKDIKDLEFFRRIKTDIELLMVYIARVSSPNQLNCDYAKLLKYCWKNSHFSVFEQVNLTMEVETDLATSMQLLRHRSLCVSGNNKLTFHLPSGGTYKKSVKWFHDRFHEGQKPIKRRGVAWDMSKINPEVKYLPSEISSLTGATVENVRALCQKNKINFEKTISKRYPKGLIHIYGSEIIKFYNNSQQQFQVLQEKDRYKKLTIRCYDEKTKEFTTTKIKDIWKSGIKDVYRIHTDNGKFVDVTEDHMILTNIGYNNIKDYLQIKKVGDKVVFNSENKMFIATNGIPVYQNKEWLENQRKILPILSLTEIAKNANTSIHTIRKYLKKFGLVFSKKEIGAVTAKNGGVWNKGKTGYTVKRNPEFNGFKDLETWKNHGKKGKENHLWRGGISKERNRIQEHCNKYRKQLYREYDYKCGMCKEPFYGRMDLHHIVPYSEDMSKALDKDNLMPVHYSCHMRHHGLEKKHHKTWRKLHDGNKLTLHYSQVVKIEYLGQEEVYDLEVEHPDHNFVCNSVVVHNCFQQLSRRYSSDNIQFAPIQARRQDKKNRQQTIDDLESSDKTWFMVEKEMIEQRALNAYQEGIKRGLGKEVLRYLLPQSLMTKMYVTGNLRNFIHYVNTRTSDGVQKEHKDLANAIKKELVRNFPVTSSAVGWKE